MSDMKCPECGHKTELKESDLCLMTICERCRLCGNRNLWDKWAESERVCLEWRKAWVSLENELERTRKALDVAVDAIKEQQRWLGIIRISMVSHLNNEKGTVFQPYDADPTVLNIGKAKVLLNNALEQINQKEQQ